jgi:hypothetical protein
MKKPFRFVLHVALCLACTLGPTTASINEDIDPLGAMVLVYLSNPDMCGYQGQVIVTAVVGGSSAVSSASYTIGSGSQKVVKVYFQDTVESVVSAVLDEHPI